MTENEAAQDTSFSPQNAHAWYCKWRDRIHDWLKRNSNSELADIVLLVPDLFVFCVGLIGDARVPAQLKAPLIPPVVYVLTPFDLIPEIPLGIPGLVDDASVLALALYWLLNIPGIDPKVWQENWPGDNNPIEVVKTLYQRITENAGTLFNNKIWGLIRNIFGGLKTS